MLRWPSDVSAPRFDKGRLSVQVSLSCAPAELWLLSRFWLRLCSGSDIYWIWVHIFFCGLTFLGVSRPTSMHGQCCADIMCFCVIRFTVNRKHTMCMFVFLGHDFFVLHCFLKDQIWTVVARFPQSWIPIVENQLSSEYQLWRWKVARNSSISRRLISDSNGKKWRFWRAA